MQYVNPFQLYLHVSIVFFLVTSIFMSIDNYRELAKTNNNQDQQKDTLNNNFKDAISFNTDNKGFELSFNTKKKKSNTVEKKDNNKNNNFVDDFIHGRNFVDSKVNKYQEKIVNDIKLIINQKEFLETINDTLLDKSERNKQVNKLLNKRVRILYDTLSKDSLFRKDKLFKYRKFKKEYLKFAVKELKANHYEINIKEKKPYEGIKTSSPWLKKYVTFYNSTTADPIKALDSLKLPKTTKNIYFYKRFQSFKKVFNGGDSTNAYASNIISKLSIALFFMLPLFTLFISLLYIRNKNNYTEHLIFVFNTQTMFFILVLIGNILDRFLETDLFTNLAILGFLFYLYKAMRKFYQQRRFKTIVKFLLLNLAYSFLAFIGFITVGLLAIIV